MSHLAKRFKAIDKSRTRLYVSLSNLLDDVSNKMPPCAEEMIYTDNFMANDGGCMELLTTSYFLTRNGVILKGNNFVDMKNGIEHIPTREFVYQFGELVAADICNAVQGILEKYKMKVPKK